MTFNYINVFISIFLCILSGALTRYTLSFTKQRWAETFHHTLSYILHPLITFVITKVISNNIALSLGMVGALSIVRFRNPVKNPLELIIYFKLVTIGIAYSVNIQWGLILVLISNLLILVLSYDKDNTKLIFFKTSFGEGDENNLIEIFSSKKINFENYEQNLVGSFQDNLKNEFSYRLVFKNRKEAKLFEKKYQNEDGIDNLRVTYD